MHDKNSSEIKSSIQGIVTDIITRMGLVAQIAITESDQEEYKKIICNIESDESKFLIGQYGINLQALQHIIRLLIRKKVTDRVNFILDVNSYRQKKDSSLASLATNTAQQVINEKREIALRPMSPYERRLIHLSLADNKHVKTESQGEKENRHIVIRPVEINQ